MLITAVVIAAGVLVILSTITRWWWISPILAGLLLLAISLGLGYPTNATFPDKATIYGLTSEYVWASTPDNPTPRSYIFTPPPEWFEERDRRSGQPFDVEKLEKGDTNKAAEQSEGDRISTGGWKILKHRLPPKDE